MVMVVIIVSTAMILLRHYKWDKDKIINSFLEGVCHHIESDCRYGIHESGRCGNL